jgi:hypothetical protein
VVLKAKKVFFFLWLHDVMPMQCIYFWKTYKGLVDSRLCGTCTVAVLGERWRKLLDFAV